MNSVSRPAAPDHVPAYPMPGRPGHFRAACPCGKWHRVRLYGGGWALAYTKPCPDLLGAVLVRHPEPYRPEWAFVRFGQPGLITPAYATYATEERTAA